MYSLSQRALGVCFFITLGISLVISSFLWLFSSVFRLLSCLVSFRAPCWSSCCRLLLFLLMRLCGLLLLFFVSFPDVPFRPVW